MMGALNQAPAQAGTASILAMLGQAVPTGTSADSPGFEQLFAALPAAATAAPTAATTLPGVPGSAQVMTLSPDALPVQTTPPAPPAAALFGLPQPGGEASPDAPAAVPTATVVDAHPEGDAAAAASLLIAVATPPRDAAPKTEKAAPRIQDGTDLPAADAEAALPAVDVPAASVAPAAQTVMETPVIAVAVATALPTADKPVAAKTAKSAVPGTTAPQRQADPALAAPSTAKTTDTVQPQPAAIATTEPKAAKPLIDTGASMAVLFQQPGMQGATTLGEAAKAAPVAERVLDLTSDDQWIAQLAADIAATKSDKGDISFRLMPRHLGRLDVSMLSGDEGVTVRLDTQHEATATVVAAAQPRLVEDLRQQGVRVADTHVTHTPAEAGRQQQNQSQGRGTMPDTSHLIETAADQADATHDERDANRRGRFA